VGEKATEVTSLKWLVRLKTKDPSSLMLQTQTLVSNPPEARKLPSFEKLTPLILPQCPFKVKIGEFRNLSASQTLTSPSTPAEARYLPFEGKADRKSIVGESVDGSKILIMVSVAAATLVPSREKATSQIQTLLRENVFSSSPFAIFQMKTLP